MPSDQKKTPELAPESKESFAGAEKKEQPVSPELAPEQVSSPETSGESPSDGASERQTEQGQEEKVSEASAAAAAVSDDDVASLDELAESIEDILEEDLTDIFLSMPPDKQAEFQAKGEETTVKIRELVEDTKKNARKIFKLIKEWLKIIPGVNRFFLEQEAKIKTDKIILTKEQQDKNQL